MKMITLIWLFLSISISLIQLLVVTQPDWIVNGQNVLVSSFERFTHRKVFSQQTHFRVYSRYAFHPIAFCGHSRPWRPSLLILWEVPVSSCRQSFSASRPARRTSRTTMRWSAMRKYSQVRLIISLTLSQLVLSFFIDYHCNYYQKCCWIGFEKKTLGMKPVPSQHLWLRFLVLP